MFGPDVYCVGYANEAREKGDTLLHCCNFARIQPSTPYKRYFQCYPQTKSVKFKFRPLVEYSTAETESEATIRYLKDQPKGWGIPTGRTDVVRGGRCFWGSCLLAVWGIFGRSDADSLCGCSLGQWCSNLWLSGSVACYVHEHTRTRQSG